MVPRAPIPNFDTGPALRFPRQAQFHPMKYLKGLGFEVDGQAQVSMNVTDLGAVSLHAAFDAVLLALPCASARALLNLQKRKLTTRDILTPAAIHNAMAVHAAFGGSTLVGSSVVMFDTAQAQELFMQGKDAYSQVWVTAAPGTSQEELRAAVARVLPKDTQAATGDATAGTAVVWSPPSPATAP